MLLRIDPSVRRQVRVGTILAAPVAVAPATAALDRELAELAAALSSRHAGTPPSGIDGLKPARDLYRSFGVDPTQTRPSSEALLRRALQGKPMPRVVNAVDLANLCSVRFLLPIGLYDADRVRGEVCLRRGHPGEAYAGIRKDEVHLGGRLVLADEEGPFGNPTSDSLRTCVSERTTRLWMMIFAPSTIPAATLRADVDFARSAIERHLGAPDRPVDTACAVEPGA